MFYKNFIFLIFPFCLQCHWNKSDKNKQGIENTNTYSDGVLNLDEKNHVLVNDNSNVFSDQIQKLSATKEKLKLYDNGNALFNDYKIALLKKNKKDLDTFIANKKNLQDLLGTNFQCLKDKFLDLIITEAQTCFIRQIEYDTSEFKTALENVVLNVNFIDNVCKIFQDNFSIDSKDKFCKSLNSLAKQYQSARNIIERDKFDS